MIKVDIISGFLGAGKTTLIKKLLKDALHKEQVVLIENEFGEIGIDAGFLKEAGIEIKEMNSGCICCSLVGDFGTSLREVIKKYHPDRILIEPSGVGKLSDVVKAIEDIAAETDIVINSTSAVVDAKKCKMYMKNFGEFFLNQVESAGAIIMSRSQDVSDEQLSVCEHLLREHNESAKIITTSWDQISGVQILQAMEHAMDMQKELEEELMKHAHHDHHNHDHNHDHCNHDHHDHCDHDHHNHDHNHDHCEHEHHEHCEHEHHEHCDHDHHDHNHEAHDANCTCGCHDHDHDHHDHSHGHHHADEVFTSWGIETGRRYTEEELKVKLEELSNDDKYGMILRAKGMLSTNEKDWIYFDFVPGEYEIRTGTAQYTGLICVIGSGLNEDALKNLFS